MTDILEIFESVWQQQTVSDLAESEFKRMLVDDPELRRQYREWCREQGLSEKLGFLTYCRERSEENESRWEPLEEDSDEDY